MAERAIGVFDSGVGGLTVFRELRRCLPGEDLVYLGDTARVPYGTKSAPTVCRYAVEAGNFLLQQQVKLIVVACNTASAVALDLLAAQFDVPIVGVIEPGSRRALEVSRHGRIGVIGTEGTIRSQAYEKAIRAGRADVTVTVAACPLFVPLAEEGWADHPVATMAAEDYLAPLLRQDIDTLVLGCTHYPLLKSTLQKIIGDGVVLIDSAEETAKTVAVLLRQHNLQRQESHRGAERYFVTDIPDRFRKVGGTFLGGSLDNVMTVAID